MVTILNAEELIRTGRSELRRQAIEIADAGLISLDPARAVRATVKRSGENLVIDGRVHSLDRPVHLLGAGKATLAMAGALEDLIGDRLTGGVVVVPETHERTLSKVEVIKGDHPIPGDRSSHAGERMVEYSETIEKGALVIATFTGGSSALVSMPPEGVPTTAKRDLHELLVGSGLDVVKMNTVRKHVSAVKGGRLGDRLAGCAIVNLTVSDVAGDVLDAITDLTIQDTTTRQDAIAVLESANLWDRVDASIRSHLGTDVAESPILNQQAIQTVLVANGATASEAMLAHARALGLNGQVVSADWGGDAAEYGRHLASLAATTDRDVLVGCGGETTVSLSGWEAAGKGGPNQELAVAAGLAMRAEVPVALIAIDTDGSDGASRYAGGLVDDLTGELWLGAGVDAADLLASHESTLALEGVGQTVLTGPTLTNVNDLFVVVVGG